MKIRKSIILTAAFSILGLSSYAQNAEKWEVKGIVGTNVSQVGLTNWSAGGENSIAGNVFLNATMERKFGKWLWTNNAALDYGLSKTQTQGIRKTTDKINFASQLGYKASEKWYYSVVGEFLSQFAEGFDYTTNATNGTLISNIFAPAYVNFSVGMEYRHKKIFSAFLSPISTKHTIVADKRLSSVGSFGVDPGKCYKFEAGALAKLKAEYSIMENVDLVTTADFFTSYNHNFGNVDVNWDVFVKMKVNKFLTATINTSLKYDDDIKTIDPTTGAKRGAKVQFKEVIGVGLSYSF